MLTETFVEKYTPKHVNDLPYDNKFISILQNFININLIQVIFVSDDSFSKNCVVNSIINTMNLAPKDIMFLSNFKDQGVSNIRSEVKLFSQIAKSHHNKKRMLIIEDIETYSDNIQKLFINNLDKWYTNINVIITTNNIYNLNESLCSRLLPINIPKICDSKIVETIKFIAKNEHINLSQDMENLIKLISENNLQTVYHILNKCSLIQFKNELTLEIIKESCTIINIETIETYFNLLKQKKVKDAYDFLLKIVENGYSVIDILNELYLYVKISESLKEEEKYKCFKIISFYIVNFITIHEEELELLILSNDLTKIL